MAKERRGKAAQVPHPQAGDEEESSLQRVHRILDDLKEKQRKEENKEILNRLSAEELLSPANS